MATSADTLQDLSRHVDESIGVRNTDWNPRLSPRAQTKDIGRSSLRSFGMLAVEQIVADPHQPRREFDPDEIEQLAESLKRTGQLHPIRVRWEPDLDKWVILTGERRFRATIRAGLDKVACYFHEGDLNASEILEQQLVENLLRSGLKPLEEARAYAELMNINSWTGKEMAASLKVSESRVCRALALLDLPEDVQQQIDSGEIAKTSAYEISKSKDTQQQRKLGQRAAAGKITQRQLSESSSSRRRKAKSESRANLKFYPENGIVLSVTGRDVKSYHEVEEALVEALEEVRLRIDNNIRL